MPGEILNECLEQGQRQIVHAVKTKIFQHVQGHALSCARQTTQDQKLHQRGYLAKWRSREGSGQAWQHAGLTGLGALLVMNLGFSGFPGMVIVILVLVTQRLAVEFVGQGVNRRIHVFAGGIGE